MFCAPCLTQKLREMACTVYQGNAVCEKHFAALLAIFSPATPACSVPVPETMQPAPDSTEPSEKLITAAELATRTNRDYTTSSGELPHEKCTHELVNLSGADPACPEHPDRAGEEHCVCGSPFLFGTCEEAGVDILATKYH